MIKELLASSIALLLALVLGTAFGIYTPIGNMISPFVDYIILALVFLTLLDIKLNHIIDVVKQPKTVIICLLTNFILIPVLGGGLAYLFLGEHPLLALGVAIYCMSPCTDWFLGFTRMAKGNVALGSVLLPINMLIQFMLYPLYLSLFSQYLVVNNPIMTVPFNTSAMDIMSTIITWFIIPAGIAICFNLILAAQPTTLMSQLKDKLLQSTSLVLYVLIFCIFAVNINTITDNYESFMLVLLTVLVFFAACFFVVAFIAKHSKLKHEDEVLFTMTTTARNAPLMLALTMTALPNQPLIYTAIICGMLIEFPYLAFLAMKFSYKKVDKQPPYQKRTTANVVNSL